MNSTNSTPNHISSSVMSTNADGNATPEAWFSARRKEKEVNDHLKRSKLVYEWITAKLEMNNNGSTTMNSSFTGSIKSNSSSRGARIITNENANNELYELIRDGSVLCRLLTKIDPSIFPPQVADHGLVIQPYKMNENISYVIRGIKAVGVPDYKLFNVNDMRDPAKFPKVVSCLLHLAFIVNDLPSLPPQTPSTKQLLQRSLTNEDGSTMLKSPMNSPSSLAFKGIGSASKKCASLFPAHVYNRSAAASPSATGHPMPSNPSSPALVSENGTQTPTLGMSLKRALLNIDGVEGTAVSKRIAWDGTEEGAIVDEEGKEKEVKEEIKEEEPMVVEDVSNMVSEEEVLEIKSKLEAIVADMKEMKEKNAQEIEALKETASKEREELVTKHNAELADAKSEFTVLMAKYRREMTLRRKIHNELQDLRGNIRVLARVRPVDDEKEKNSTVVTGFPSEDQVDIFNPESTSGQLFEFDRVFPPTSTQSQVFDEVAPLVISCLDGYNVCIFAYGQTGSGKTYTMEGPAHDPGVNSRALQTLFEVMSDRSDDCSFDVKVSQIEIYNEKIRDLLVSPKQDAGVKHEVKHNKDSGVFITDLCYEKVGCFEDVVAVMAKGSRNRVVEATKMNERSSRSHCIVQVIVSGFNETTQTRFQGKLNLVDLAGSERVSRTGAEGDRLTEARNINKSLSALGDVIASLIEKKSHVPFRNSKLTYALQDSLGGDSKTLMFVQISPVLESMKESICSLNFASRVRNVELKGKRHADVSDDKKYKHMIARIKAKDTETESLAMKLRLAENKLFAAQDQVSYLQVELQQAQDSASSAQSTKSAAEKTASTKDKEIATLRRKVAGFTSQLQAEKDAASKARLEAKRADAALSKVQLQLDTLKQEAATSDRLYETFSAGSSGGSRPSSAVSRASTITTRRGTASYTAPTSASAARLSRKRRSAGDDTTSADAENRRANVQTRSATAATSSTSTTTTTTSTRLTKRRKILDSGVGPKKTGLGSLSSAKRVARKPLPKWNSSASTGVTKARVGFGAVKKAAWD